MKEHDTPVKNYDLERLLFFSDGVFAIAITLLAIELHPPHGWDGRFETLFNATAGLLIFYAISFFAIAMFWMAHRGVFRHVIKFNEVASLLNILFLMFFCLVPCSQLSVWRRAPVDRCHNHLCRADEHHVFLARAFVGLSRLCRQGHRPAFIDIVQMVCAFTPQPFPANNERCSLVDIL